MERVIQIEIVNLNGEDAYIIDNTVGLTAKDAIRHLQAAISIIQRGCITHSKLHGPESFETLDLHKAVEHTVINLRDLINK